ncbi:unannotated protein [freshwater metagenome]|uniref:Unannotated protein n=1 Tax=freshwater metagenome TaxID=449393 RepID=A0A6J7K0Q2_9ZZZZ
MSAKAPIDPITVVHSALRGPDSPTSATAPTSPTRVCSARSIAPLDMRVPGPARSSTTSTASGVEIVRRS